VSATEFRDFFWPALVGLIEPACRQSSQSEEIFSLCVTFYKQLRASDDPVLDLENLVGKCSRLLLEYKAREVSVEVLFITPAQPSTAILNPCCNRIYLSLSSWISLLKGSLG
jgi:hypothetical protein